MKYLIRASLETDMSKILRLIQELAIFEEEENAVEVSVEDLKRDGFGENKLFHCFVAESEDEIVGMALIYPRYSTWKGAVIHLEDLIVTKSFRGSGVGGALLTEVVKYGHELGVRRIGWEVLDWNDGAIAFYESKGAKVMRDWNVVQLNQEGMQNFINNL